MYYHRQVTRRLEGKHFSKDSFQGTFCDILNTKACSEIDRVVVICTSRGAASCPQQRLHFARLYICFSSRAHRPLGGCGGVSSPSPAQGDDAHTMSALFLGAAVASPDCVLLLARHITTLSNVTLPRSVRLGGWWQCPP